MKTRNEMMRLSVIALAVQSALGVMFFMPTQAMAEDDVSALVNPSNTLELGIKNVPTASSKYGEYNGMNQSRAYGVGNVDIRGGDSYGQGSGLTRWSIKATDLGTDSDNLQANYGAQGQWSLGFGFDQLKHDITNTYQSPFTGTMGGNSFTLPTTFGVINTTAVTGSNSQAVGTRALTATQLAAFQTYDVYTQRDTTSFNAALALNSQWDVQFDFSELQQKGAKLLGAASSGVFTPASWTREAPVTLMNPTNYRTDNMNFAANWHAADSFMTASYYMSFFRNTDNMLFWNNPMVAGNAITGLPVTSSAQGYQGNALSVMPDNSFYQLNLTGGTRLSTTTRLTGGFSYGNNTQNAGYLIDPSVLQGGAAGSPRTALGGNVVTTHADLKLSDQTSKDLNLSAAFKYNQRLNTTESSVYRMFDIGGGAGYAYQGANASSTARTEINTPYSNTKSSLELAGDYRLDSKSNLRMAYEHEDLHRWCASVAGAAAPTYVSGPGNVASPAGANCVVVTGDTEDKLGLNFRGKSGDSLGYNIGYGYSQRQSQYDHNALTPLNDAAGANGTGIVNASDYRGFLAGYEASRVQNLIKAGVNWQQNDQWSFGVSGRVTADQYTDSTLGVQAGHSRGINFDTAYNYSDSGVATAYVSYQDRDRVMLSGNAGTNVDNQTSYSSAPVITNIWRNVLTDADATVGLNLTQKGLMAGKLEVSADLSYSTAQSQYHTDVPYQTLATCGAATSLACGDAPAITYTTTSIKLTGKYQVHKKGTLMVGYQYQQLQSSDYYFNALQYGYTPSTVLPTNQQAPDYTVNAVAVAYTYTF